MFVYILFRQVTGDSNVCVEKVTDSYGLSEGPHWDHRSQKLFFVDIYNQYIRRLDPATGVVTSAHLSKAMHLFFTCHILYRKVINNSFNDILLDSTVGCVVPVTGSPDQFVAGVGKDVVLVTWDGEENEEEVPTEVLCSVDEKSIKTRINDGKVDSSGRFWLGK